MMRIAEEVVKQGMSAGTAFMDEITRVIRENGLKNIIETGSYLGTGTTQAIRLALTGGEKVYSIEVNPKHHNIAKDAHKGSGINFLLGLSVPKPELPIDMTFNCPDWVVIDHYPHNRHQLYAREVAFNVPDDMLAYALLKMDHRPDLVILDSAGHMGWAEFQYLTKLVPSDHSYLLALDDTNHVKHYETMQYVKANPEKYTVLFTTDQKFGSAIVQVAAD